MRERPILFSAPMVNAILDGKKTQTRRAVKPQPDGGLVGGTAMHSGDPIDDLWYDEHTVESEDGPRAYQCPYGVPGDRLWVRETWRLDGWCETPEATVTYRADGTQDAIRVLVDDYDVFVDNECRRMEAAGAIEDKDGNLTLPDGSSPPWRPSIFMPRWASRITLTITDVRVQRLHDITEEDALAEGCCRSDDASDPWGPPTARAAFAILWDSINGTDAWMGNPWVWALTFEVTHEGG